jgi:hypothetical protein
MRLVLFCMQNRTFGPYLTRGALGAGVPGGRRSAARHHVLRRPGRREDADPRGLPHGPRARARAQVSAGRADGAPQAAVALISCRVRQRPGALWCRVLWPQVAAGRADGAHLEPL